MTSCPYPVHQAPFDLAITKMPVAYCRDGCGRTFFLCEKCQEANRPAARFCRHCGEAILYEAAQAHLDSDRPLQQERTESHKLGAYGVTEVQTIKAHKGFLIVIGDQSVLVYDLHRNYAPLCQFNPPDRRIIRGVTIVADNDDELLLVTTSRSVYRLSLLTMKPDATPAYEASSGSYITQAIVSCGAELFALELDEKVQNSRLMRLSGEEVFSFEGRGRSLFPLTDNRFFFCTQDHVFMYRDGKVARKKMPEQLAETEAAYNADADLVFLVGESGLWRVVTSNQDLETVNLPTRILGAPLLAANSDSVFVAHTQGFLVLDSFGGIRWDSGSQSIRAESDGNSPQPTSGYVLFTALGQTGGSKLRIHALNDLNDFRTIDYEYRLFCPPLLTLGRVLSAIGGAGQATLVCTM